MPSYEGYFVPDGRADCRVRMDEAVLHKMLTGQDWTGGRDVDERGRERLGVLRNSGPC